MRDFIRFWMRMHTRRGNGAGANGVLVSDLARRSILHSVISSVERLYEKHIMPPKPSTFQERLVT